MASLYSFTELSLGLSLQCWEQGKRLGCKIWELPWGLLLLWKANQTPLGKTWEPQVLPMGQLVFWAACPTPPQARWMLRKAQTPLHELQSRTKPLVISCCSLNFHCCSGVISCCWGTSSPSCPRKPEVWRLSLHRQGMQATSSLQGAMQVWWPVQAPLPCLYSGKTLVSPESWFLVSAANAEKKCDSFWERRSSLKRK